MAELRCPHCRTALPEKAVFCAQCGRRIEGWAAPPRDGGERPLPDGDQATRQMSVSPSLLRILALSKRRGGVGWRIGVGMLLVALIGGLASFWAVRLQRRRVTTVASQTAVEPTTIEPESQEPPPPTTTPPTTTPHKQVFTDSQSKSQQEQKQQRGAAPAPSLALPTAEKETATVAAAAKPEAAAKQEGEATLDADGVRLVVRHHLPQVRACYGRAFKDVSPGGTVEIGFAIDRGGHAQNVRTETNTTDSVELARCLEARVREWQFPRPVGGDYELIYPFVFAPGS